MKLDPAAVRPEDLATPDVVADPYPYYEALRSRSPVWGYADWPPGTVPGQDPPVRAWALLRYEHVAAAARDHKTFSSANFQQQTTAPMLMLVNHDEPEHAKIRRLVQKAFTPKRVQDLKPAVEAICREIVASLPDGSFDAVARVASELPARVMLHLLGLPASDVESFKRWANAFMLSADMTADERNRSNAEMIAYFEAKVAARRGALEAGETPRDDLMDALLLAELDGARLSEADVVRFCFTLVVAGSETTMYFATNVLDALLEHPEIYARLRGEPDLVPRLLEETLRVSGPPQRLFRMATRDVEIGGARIKKGEWVALFFAAANHDPEVFPNPTELRLDRPNAGDHLTYGIGIHYCLGAPLANLEVTSLLEELLASCESLERGTGARVPQTATLLQKSFTRLPMVVHRQAAKSPEARNLEVVGSVFARFGAKDVPAILELLDDDVTIEFYGPPTIPYANTYRGKGEARRFFETVLSSVDIRQFEPEEFIARGDKVVVTGHLNLVALPTGRTIDSDFVHVITVENGKWRRFRDFMNTAVAVEAFSGA